MREKNSEYNVDDLIVKAKNGDIEARGQIVEKNVGLIWSVAKKFYNRGHEPEDLFQIGSIGLIKAIQKFDSSFGVKFSTYAVPMIMGEIKRFIRDDGIIKVSRSLKELSIKAMGIKEALERENGEEPKMSDIAARMEIPVEELAMALEAGARPESLYNSTDDGNREGKSLIDKIESDENHEDTIVDKIVLKDVLEKFPEREQKIIVLRYFKQKTQAQIAEMLGISQVQVSRIEKRVLLQMREKILGG